MMEALQVETGGAQRDTQAFFPAWLACLTFYYPIFWLSSSLVWAGPNLAAAALFRAPLDYFRIHPFGLDAGVDSARLSSLQARIFASQAFEALAPAVIVLIIALLVWLVARRERVLSGLFIATLANVALGFKFTPVVFFHQPSSAVLVATAIFYFVLMCLGLLRMLAAWPEGESLRRANQSGYLHRMGMLLASFALLPVLLWLGFMLFARFRFEREIAVLVAPGVLAAALASLRPARTLRDRRPVDWRFVAVGILASLFLVMGAREGSLAMERANQARIEKLLAAYPAPDPNPAYPKLFFQRGVNFTVEGPGGYASDEGRQVLESLPQYGVNAVALVPYGFTRRGKSPTVGFGSWETDDMMRVGARIAHARGMKVMLKPAMWQAIDLDFPTADERAQWFRQYQDYIAQYARLAAEIHADVFCIGGEFAHLSEYDAEWRKLIALVRTLYPGPLVYAANFGPEFEHITFWDALDYIGLQEYYPLPDNLDVGAVMAKVVAVQQRFNRPVIFTEAGFTSMEGANREPWDDSHPTKLAVDWQAKCYDALLRAFYDKPWFEGVYWWKVGTNGAGGCQDGSFTPWRKPAMDVVKHWYLDGRR